MALRKLLIIEKSKIKKKKNRDIVIARDQLLTIKKNWPFIRFVLIALAIYLLWSLATSFFLAPGKGIDRWLINTEGVLSSKFLNLLGYNTYIVEKRTQCVLYLESMRLIGISNSCNGLSLIVLYNGFLLAYPGNWKNKLLFILAGTTFIYLINIVRIASLAIIYLKYPNWLEFNHHFTFTALVYSIVFLLWMLFVNKFTGLLSAKEVE